MRWSIRTKIVTVLSALLVVAIFAYLILADQVFREDKRLLVFDSNRSATERLAGGLDSSLRRILDKMEVLAGLGLGGSGGVAARRFFEADAELLIVELIGQREGRPHVLRELVSRERLGRIGLDLDTLRASDALELVPAERVSRVTLENRSLPQAILFRVRVPARSGSEVLYAQALVDGRDWIENFQSHAISLDFAVTVEGDLIAHPKAALVAARENLKGHPFVRLASGETIPSRQLQFEEGGKKFLGVYQKAALGGVTVFSMTDKAVALSAGSLLLEKSIMLSLIVVTTVFLISLWFASSLSSPILRLVRATEELAKGRFDTRIDVRSGDEIGILAVAFQRMAGELRSSRVQLEDYSRGLAEKVAERTRELEEKNAAIREQQEALMRATRLAAVGEIAGHAAHEVLNPLTGMIARIEALADRIKTFHGPEAAATRTLKAIVAGWRASLARGGVEGWARALQEKSEAQAGRSMLEEDLANLDAIAGYAETLGDLLLGDMRLLREEAFRISRIVDGMRGMSRASAVPSVTSLADLIRESVRADEDMLARYRIRIETAFASEPRVLVDRDEIRQIFINLVKNATEAIEARRLAEPKTGGGPPGLIRITVAEDDGKAVVRIWDNGHGIARGHRARIFEADFTTKGSAGTGLGLSICRRLARAAGGELTLRDSVPGEFSEFELTLPVVRDG